MDAKRLKAIVWDNSPSSAEERQEVIKGKLLEKKLKRYRYMFGKTGERKYMLRYARWFNGILKLQVVQHLAERLQLDEENCLLSIKQHPDSTPPFVQYILVLIDPAAKGEKEGWLAFSATRLDSICHGVDNLIGYFLSVQQAESLR